MSHLGDRLAEFVYEELSLKEMAEARQHVADCSECQQQVEEFRNVRHALKAWPDEDPPRRVVFAPADHVRRRLAVPLRWLAPLASAALLVLAVVLVGPLHVDWGDSRLTIAFGKMPANRLQAPGRELQPAESAVRSPESGAQSPESGARLESEIRSLETKLEEMAVAHAREIQRVRGEMTYVESLQRAARKETIENASSIQLLARRAELQD